MSSIIKVFKFGGASVSAAEGVRNLGEVVKRYNENLVVVVSAMGKTTNALEVILAKYLEKDSTYTSNIEQLRDFHINILANLFTNDLDEQKQKLNALFVEIEDFIKSNRNTDYNYCYDQIVSYGELISTIIVSAYLNNVGIKNQWIDIRTCLQSDATYREGNIDYKKSESLAKNTFTFNCMRITNNS